MPQKQQKPSLAALLRPVTYGKRSSNNNNLRPSGRNSVEPHAASETSTQDGDDLQRTKRPTKGLLPSHFASTVNNQNQSKPHDPDIDRSISMALNFLRPGVPGMQPVGDLHTAKSAILFGVINGLFSPPVLELCLCTGGRRRSLCRGDDDDDAEQQRYYQLANFVLAMLGVALLFVDMALSSRAVIFASPLWPAVVRWMVWLTKALTCGTLQFGVNVVYFCLRMLLASKKWQTDREE